MFGHRFDSGRLHFTCTVFPYRFFIFYKTGTIFLICMIHTNYLKGIMNAVLPVIDKINESY